MSSGAPTPAQEDEAVYRLAAMVARGAAIEDIFDAMADELARLLAAQRVVLKATSPDLSLRTVASWGSAREIPPQHRLERPIVVDGQVWGVLWVGTTGQIPLGPLAERIMEACIELLALAARAAQDRVSMRRLAQDQRALRSVATLVARGAGSEELYAAITQAAGASLDADHADLVRFGGGDGVEQLVHWSRSGDGIERGRQPELTGYGPTGLSSLVMAAGRPWGAMTVVATAGVPLPSDAPRRLLAFAELLGNAIATVSNREQLARLVDEEAVLRRMATLVAAGSDPRRVFEAVTEEVGRLLGADLAALGRVEEANRIFRVVATWSRMGTPPEQPRLPLVGENVITAAVATGRPAWQAGVEPRGGGPLEEFARLQGVAESVAVPIMVQGSVWGVIIVSSAGTNTLQPNSGSRLADFTELVATAVANAQSRDDLAASRARIVAAADGARARIERDLQDGVQQRLVSLGLSLRSAAATLESSEPTAPWELTELKQTLERLTRGFAGAYGDLQEIARGIHPAVLAEGGLRSALAVLARRSPTPVRFEVGELPRLPDSLEVAAYYAASEALTNAIKHAQASSIEMTAGVEQGTLTLTVTDDGLGGVDLTAGSGLIGLRDRIVTLAGKMTVTSPPGGGTAITVTLPTFTDAASATGRGASQLA